MSANSSGSRSTSHSASSREGEENRTNNHQYEYPYLMQTHDGMLHLVYAANTRAGIKYVRTTEQDVMGSRRERVGLYNPTAAQIR